MLEPSHAASGLTIVGVGASAGGLAALRTLLGAMPERPGVAFVVVVHLSPEHESRLAELLQPHCPMPVQQVSGSVQLERDRVYVIPPNANLEAIDTHLRLSELEARRRERAPIDHFFRTLSQTHDGHSIGIVLTGTGTDGTLGLRWIKDEGGVTIAQLPEEAEHDGMPRSAIESGRVDLVLPIAEMPEHILRIANTEPRLRIADVRQDELQEDERLLLQIFSALRARTGHDFTSYKRSTILRRLRRRMQIHQIESLRDYLHLLREQREEQTQLFDDLLITVTEFFRDEEVFDRLAEKVIPEILDRKGPEGNVRVWSVGCSTGEEAYSLAMLLLEERARRRGGAEVQIFATDLHERSLRAAREGVYPESISSRVSPERLTRFFREEHGGYRMRKEVRELIVFAPHDFLKDPPFSHMDLIVCRNVLIYLQRAVHQDVLAVFHYALNPDGVLILGSSETAEGSDLFSCEDKSACIFRRRNVPTREPRLPLFAAGPHGSRMLNPTLPTSGAVSYGALHSRMVERYAPPSVLISERHEIVHHSAHAGEFLQVPGGERTHNVFKLVREPLRVDLRAALHVAAENQIMVRTRPIAVSIDGRERHVVLRVRPAADPELQGFFLVIFDEAEEPGNASGEAAEEASGATVAELETQLDLSRQRVQGIIEEYETGQEELQASNEELQSANEELRSTLEELETSREELQSMNEELVTVNQENRHRVEELSQISTDLQNLIVSTEIATLFLDRHLRIVRFTPQVSELFSIRTTDRGRPLADFTSTLGYDELRQDAQRVLDRLSPIEREVRSERGNWFLARIMPYRTSDDRIEGVVLTLLDITARKHAQEALRESEVMLQRIVNNAPVGIAVLRGERLEFVSVNPAYQAIVGPAAQFVGRTYRELFPHSMHRGSEECLHEAMRTGRRAKLRDFVVQTPGRPGTTWWEGDCLPLPNEGGETDSIMLLVWEITDRKRAEEALRRSEEQFRELVAQVKDYAIFRIDLLGRPVTWNEGVRRVLGFEQDEFIGLDTSAAIFTPEDQAAGVPQRELEHAAAHGSANNDRWLRRKSGERFFALGITSAIKDDSGRVTGFTKVMRDHTRLKETEESLRESEERLRLAAEATGFGTYDFDPRSGTAVWSDRLREILGVAREGPLDPIAVLRSVVHPDDREDLLDSMRRTLEDERHGPHQIEFRIRADGQTRWLRDAGHAIFAGERGARRAVRVVGTILDITELKRHEEQMRFVMAELNHRVKNTLAVVEATADQTFRHTPDPEQFIASFGARLRALSQAHQLLTRSEWSGARIEDIFRIELESRVEKPSQLRLTGPDLMIRPDAAMALHMVVHELSTNAAKYGALSTKEGRVTVEWRLKPSDNPETLHIQWTERDGPPCVKPKRHGFGAKVLDRTVSYQLEGEVLLEYPPEGLRCTILIPWKESLGVGDNGLPSLGQTSEAGVRAK